MIYTGGVKPILTVTSIFFEIPSISINKAIIKTDTPITNLSSRILFPLRDKVIKIIERINKKGENTFSILKYSSTSVMHLNFVLATHPPLLRNLFNYLYFYLKFCTQG